MNANWLGQHVGTLCLGTGMIVAVMLLTASNPLSNDDAAEHMETPAEPNDTSALDAALDKVEGAVHDLLTDLDTA